MANDLLTPLRAVLPDGVSIDSYLDEGGQGAVFRGAADGISAAIKLFMPGADPRRLERELELLKSVSCPYLVQIIRNDWIEFRGARLPLVSYRYHTGGDLRAFLEVNNQTISYTELLTLGSHICQAVEALWQKRIVHRDIKPANIVSDPDGRFVLVDVGLARHIDRSDITAPGAAPGTPGYKSPEQAAGRRHLTVRSDWFSLGITLYHVAARTHPFNGMQYSIGVMAPAPLRDHRPDLPQPFCRLVHEMLAVVPARRPRNAGTRLQQLLEAYRKCLS